MRRKVLQRIATLAAVAVMALGSTFTSWAWDCRIDGSGELTRGIPDAQETVTLYDGTAVSVWLQPKGEVLIFSQGDSGVSAPEGSYVYVTPFYTEVIDEPYMDTISLGLYEDGKQVNLINVWNDYIKQWENSQYFTPPSWDKMIFYVEMTSPDNRGSGIYVRMIDGAAVQEGGWVQDAAGWWYKNADGSYPKAAWQAIGGKLYYFNGDGYMLANTVTPDGYTVGADGAWIQ